MTTPNATPDPLVIALRDSRFRLARAIGAAILNLRSIPDTEDIRDDLQHALNQEYRQKEGDRMTESVKVDAANRMLIVACQTCGHRAWTSCVLEGHRLEPGGWAYPMPGELDLLLAERLDALVEKFEQERRKYPGAEVCEVWATEKPERWWRQKLAALKGQVGT